MNDWTDVYFSMADGNIIDSTHDTIKFYSLNGENYYHPLPDLDLPRVSLHCDLDSIANGYVSEINKEYQLESMKQGAINTSMSSTFKILFSTDVSNNWIHT
jgi:hypothetical protein